MHLYRRMIGEEAPTRRALTVLKRREQGGLGGLGGLPALRVSRLVRLQPATDHSPPSTNESSGALMNERVIGTNTRHCPSSIEPTTRTLPPGRSSQRTSISIW